MEEEQYCLKWNNHQSTLLTVLTGLMDTERLADCILSAEGKMLKAHQVIISACSPYLEKLLNESRQPGYMPILIFSDLVFDELVAMKEYMYKGEVNIRQDALDSFLKAACNLQIKGLADGGGGGDEGGGGGGGKRKAPPEIVDSSPARAGRRRRRESRESDHTQDMIPQEPQLPQPVPAKKQNVFTAKVEPFEPAPVVKLEPIMDQPPMPQPQIQHAPQLVMKPEPQDHHEPETHDLTGLDDDEDYDYDMPGTSQPDLSQDISNWQMDNSMHSAEDFAASQSMNTSQPGQSSQGLFLCFHCNRVFTRKSNLIRHQKNSCFKTVRNVNCPFCPAIVGSYDSLRGHVDFVHPKKHLADLQTLYCKWCSYKTKFSVYLDSHQAEEHPKEMGRALKDSNKQVTSNSSEEVTLECCYCPFRSDSKSSLLLHQTQKHPVKLLGSQSMAKGLNEKERSFNKNRCSYCSFTAESELIVHNHEYMKHHDALLDRSSQNENSQPLQFFNKIKCSYCSFLAENQKVLDAHQYVKHPVELLKKNLLKSKTDKA